MDQEILKSFVFNKTYENLQTIKDTSLNLLQENGFNVKNEREHINKIGFEQYLSEISPLVDLIEDSKLQLDFKRNIFNNERTNMSNIYEDSNGKKIIFFFSSDTSNTQILKVFCKILMLLESKEGIIVTEKKPTTTFTSTCKKLQLINEENADLYNINHYSDENFIDITKHAYTPKIIKIYRGPERDEFLKQNNIKDMYKFPHMLLSDPVSKFYRLNIGDIVKFERENGLTDSLLEKTLNYRVVVFD